MNSIYKKTIGTPLQPLIVYKVVRYEKNYSDVPEETDVTELYLNGKPLHKENTFIEFRIEWLSKKYRFVSNEDDVYPSVNHCIQKPKNENLIVSATLFNSVDSVYEDVLDRVQKFNGPCYDGFRVKVLMKQMFMNDDIHQHMKLMVITRNGKSHLFGMEDEFDLNK